LTASSDKRGSVPNDVIDGKRQNHRLLVASGSKAAPAARGPGIAPHRRRQDVGFDADLRKLLQHHESIGGIGYHDRRTNRPVRLMGG
jgi:hypothetical protein